jgi:hypothetical protein
MTVQEKRVRERKVQAATLPGHHRKKRPVEKKLAPPTNPPKPVSADEQPDFWFSWS